VREARVSASTRAVRRAGAGGALADRLERELAAGARVLAQTDLRRAGQRTTPDRRVSLVDVAARRIRRGNRASRPS
jgi:hypothetical protein